MRKAPSLLPLALALTVLAATPAPADNNSGRIASQVAQMLENNHYSRHAFDSEMSTRVLDGYLNLLDPSHIYFTQAEVDQFKEKYEKSLDHLIKDRNIEPAFEIYQIYNDRVKERVAFVKKTLETKKFTFDSNREITIKRDKVPWPKDKAEADSLWSDLIEADLLAERLSDISREEAKKRKEEEKKAKEAKANEAKPDQAKADDKKKDKPEAEVKKAPEEKEETPTERVVKRYERLLEQLAENEQEDVANLFLSCIANSYDPHTEYMSPQETDNFRIQMNHSLVGIGALLSTKDNLAEIRGIVVGGPADKQGELKLNDKILAVAQGETGEWVDIKYMKLNKIVEMIRGKVGTVVRIKINPADADDPSMVKEIAIIRGEVELKEKLANAEMIVTPESKKLGWINLSSFYADMEEGTVSCSADVERLLRRLMKEKIEGLVIDLRGDGGGSLEEAIKLTGLFIPKGPVVQAKDARGKITWRECESERAVYEGPMIVLTDKASASASEIFAAALQDYRRAVIVGEKSTFGKGTVQTIIPVDRYFASAVSLLNMNKPKAGALKVTIQKFYRIVGGSTQLRGVIPDIQLPSIRDIMDIGEESLPFALPYDTIPERMFTYASKAPLPISELQTRAKNRMENNPEFQYIIDDSKRLDDRIKKNTVSLNEKDRLKELEENRVRVDQRKVDRKANVQKLTEAKTEGFTNYRLTLDNVDAEGLVAESKFTKEDSTGMRMANDEEDSEESGSDPASTLPYGIEPVKLETLHILSDIISLSASQPTTANAAETVKRPAGL